MSAQRKRSHSHNQPDQGQSQVTRKRDARIGAVLRTSAKLFAQKGYERTNLRDIAAELDMRGPSLYYYFSTKEELFLRCVETSARTVRKRLNEVAVGSEPPVERLRLVIREQILLELRDLPEFGPLFVKIQITDPKVKRTVQKLGQKHIGIFREIMREVVESGEAPQKDSTIKIMLAFGAVSFLQEWYDPAGALSVEEFAEKTSKLLVSFLITPSLYP